MTEEFSIDNYRKKIESIYTRFPSVQKVAFSDAYKPGLENMLRFEALLGDPHLRFRTVHVAGTNGKGSVANMLASALASAGLKVGLYTSPHLVDFRERMRIAGRSTELVSEEYVYDFLCRCETGMDDLGLSFFEITTGMAFKWFADEQVDVAVIEVGLGGRLDSTNVITPDLSVVTSIALDHCALLGNTLEAIAGEKAGIFKKDVPALVGEWLPQTRPVFEAKAGGFCPLTFAQDAEPSLWDQSGLILGKMDLRGGYQKKNLRTALAAIDILKNMPAYKGLSDSEAVVDALEHAAARMGFHGRWEKLSSDPFIIADMGHNPAALRENFAQLESMVASGECTSLIIVYAVMADKDLDGIMPLMPQEATYIFTAPAIRRALPEKELAARCRAFFEAAGRPTDRLFEASSVREALSEAVRLASESEEGGKPLVFVGGSAYLVSEALQEIGSVLPRP